MLFIMMTITFVLIKIISILTMVLDCVGSMIIILSYTIVEVVSLKHIMKLRRPLNMKAIVV